MKRSSISYYLQSIQMAAFSSISVDDFLPCTSVMKSFAFTSCAVFPKAHSQLWDGCQINWETVFSRSNEMDTHWLLQGIYAKSSCLSPTLPSPGAGNDQRQLLCPLHSLYPTLSLLVTWLWPSMPNSCVPVSPCATRGHPYGCCEDPRSAT